MDTNNNKKISFSLFLAIRNIVYGDIGLLNKIFPSKKPRIVVYCYHSVSNDGWRFSVTKEEFERQMKLLLKDKTPLAVRDLPAYISGEKKLQKDAFVITFDDGYADILEVKDFLKENSIYPCAFILSNTKETNYGELTIHKEFLSVDQVHELVQAGWDIGSHSATHADFSKLNDGEIATEVVGSKESLERSLGLKIDYFAYPKGQYTEKIVKNVENAGYKYAFSMNDGYVGEATDRLLIPRVGVDGTHTMKQFPYIALPLAMAFRKVIKKIF